MLDVYELNVFLTAAETENFSEAARQLHLTQPAVSMQIRALEKKLDVDLFYRCGRTLSLTEQGRALVPLARDVVSRAIQIEEELESLRGEVVGHLRLGCSTTTGKYILPHLVAGFRERHPKVQMTIYNHGREAVLEELDLGAVQLAVVSAQPSGLEVEYRHFFTDNVVLVVPAGHCWAGRDIIAPEELRHVPFILRGDSASGTRQEVEEMLGEVGLGVGDLNVVMEIGNSEAISMAVEEGIGVAFVSRTVARRGIEIGRLKEVRVAGVSLKREVYIAYSRRHPATRAQMEFWSFVQEPENERLRQVAA